MRVHGEDEEPTADKVLQFVIPQLLERALDGRPPDLLYDAFHYPERMNVSHRDENVIESHHFHEVTLSNFNWKEALPAMESLRDEIMMQFNSGVLTRWEAVMRMNSAMSALGHREVFLPALHGLYRLDGQDLNGANDV
jgi:hypothetical protein